MCYQGHQCKKIQPKFCRFDTSCCTKFTLWYIITQARKHWRSRTGGQLLPRAEAMQNMTLIPFLMLIREKDETQLKHIYICWHFFKTCWFWINQNKSTTCTTTSTQDFNFSYGSGIQTKVEQKWMPKLELKAWIYSTLKPN